MESNIMRFIEYFI